MSVPAPMPQGELSLIDAAGLFSRAGFEAGCGWPLPDGSLPVGGKGLGNAMFRISREEWEIYRARCAAERLPVAAL